MAHLQGQDWNDIVIRKAAPKGRAALRSGDNIVIKKHDAGSNRNRAGPQNARKLEETDELKHKTLDRSVAQVIQHARQVKGWTQKELAARIAEKPHVVAEYEQAAALPSQQILAKMERALQIKLRGKDIGEPIVLKRK